MAHVVLIVGPTASGKTKLGIEVASQLKTIILSADARQVYKEMSIGTAKPSKIELEAVPHFLVDHRSIHEEYNAAMYEQEALSELNKQFERNPHKPVVVVGGSGLYLKALTQGLDIMPTISAEIREKVRQRLENEPLSNLIDELKVIDPNYAKQADLQNPRRLQRALEVFLATGMPYSSFRKEQPKRRDFTYTWIGIDLPRPLLYERINQRVDEMLNNGLVEEAKSLSSYKDLQALQTVGYVELFDHFEGKISLDEAVENIKINTRRYAKRQLTWFRRQVEEIHWIYEADLKKTIEILEGK